MLNRFRPRSLYDVLAASAFFLVIAGGTAAAVDGSLPGQNTVGTADIINGEVRADDLAANSVGAAKINDGSVKNADLGPNAASSNTIADGGVQRVDVADESLTENEIADIISSGGLTRIAVGEEKTLLQDGPFTVTANCILDPSSGPGFYSYVAVYSSEEHSIAALDTEPPGGSGGEIPDSGRGVRGPGDGFPWGGSHFFAAAPSGATLEGYIGAGADMLGYDDCTGVATAMG